MEIKTTKHIISISKALETQQTMNNPSSFYSRSEILKIYFDGSLLTSNDIQRTIASMLAPDELSVVFQKDFDPKISAMKQDILKRFIVGSIPSADDYAAWIDTMLNLKDDYQQDLPEIETRNELKARFAPESFLTVADYHILIKSMVNWTDDKKILDTK
ncbi:hypothetical protein [uncultured Dokdonia sp.]|uniref:hypothetical protein n=1 Tax=uncultured Dokdonia sp. TaxID=575653 RepID=UPI00261D2445|nr:hypothetical protein [uncultured Dokdonia sp.]